MNKTAQHSSLLLLTLLIGFPQLSETIYTPSLPDIAHSLNVHEALVEYTLSIYFIGFALGVFLWGVLADILGRRSSMLLGLGVYCLGSLGCNFSLTIESLLFFRLIQAFGASAGSVVTQTMIRDCYFGAERNRVFSFLWGALALSPAVGPVIGGYVDQLVGWQGNFSLLVGLGVVLFGYTYLRLPETYKKENRQNFQFWTVAKTLCLDKKALGYAFLVGGCNGIIFGYYAEAPFIFIDLMHYSPTQYGLFGLIVASASLLSAYLSRKLNKRWETQSILSLGMALILFFSLYLADLTFLGLFRQRVDFINLFLILSGLGGLFIGIGIVIPNAISQALASYQTMSGTAGALFGLMYYLLIAVFTFLMGWMHNGTAWAMPLYFIGLTITMIFISYWTIFKEKIVVKPISA